MLPPSSPRRALPAWVLTGAGLGWGLAAGEGHWPSLGGEFCSQSVMAQTKYRFAENILEEASSVLSQLLPWLLLASFSPGICA